MTKAKSKSSDIARAPTPSARLDPTESELVALLDDLFISTQRQPGEITAFEAAKRYMVSADLARDRLEREVRLGTMTRRRAGRYVYYRKCSNSAETPTPKRRA